MSTARRGLATLVLTIVTACSLPAPTAPPVTETPTRSIVIAPPTPVLPTPAGNRPITTLTPGNVATTLATDVCTPGWASAHRRALSLAQKQTIARAYVLLPAQRVAEWDHLVSLELGGGNGVANIWPQLSRADSSRKDRLENLLHRLVCGGRLSLFSAQARIRQYWLYW